MDKFAGLQQEITPLDPDDLFIILNRPDAKFDYAIHWHTDFELNMVIGSYGMRVIGDSKEEFDDLDIVLVGPRTPHIWSGEIEEGNHVVTIQFHEQVLEYPTFHKRIFSNILNLLSSSRRGVVFEGEAKKEIRDRILRLTQSEGIDSANGFLSLLDYMGRTSGKRELASPGYQEDFLHSYSKSRRISLVCNYVVNNYFNDINVAEAAEMVNMTETAFCHFFKKKTGKTFKDYVNDVRIGKASKLLYETSGTISEICYACGFNSTTNFIRMFKKKRGETPSDYRDNIKKIISKY